MTGALALSMVFSMVITGISAVIFDKLIFRRVREKGEELSMVFASFGLALIIRNAIGLIFGLQTKLYSQDIVFATVLSRDPLVLVKPDQLATLGITLAIILLLHLILSRTIFWLCLAGGSGKPVAGAGQRDKPATDDCGRLGAWRRLGRPSRVCSMG